jgi:hypothetical protein
MLLVTLSLVSSQLVNSVCTRHLNTATVLKQWSCEEVCALIWLMQEWIGSWNSSSWEVPLMCTIIVFTYIKQRSPHLFQGVLCLFITKLVTHCHYKLIQFCTGSNVEQTVNLASSSYSLFSLLTQNLRGHRFNANDVCKMMTGKIAEWLVSLYGNYGEK